MLKTLSINPNERKKQKYGLKKNLSSLTTTAKNHNPKNNMNITLTNNINTHQKKPIALFIENNPYHYKLPSTINKKLNIKVFSERNYLSKRLMDSIESFSKKKNLNSDQYNSCISDLMTKYIYSNPDAESNINTNYELTKTKIKFFMERKKKIQKMLKKSKSMFKYSTSESKFDEGDDRSTMVQVKNMEYKDPYDSLGLVLRNKIVHDKILLNYQDRQVQDFGKIIKFYNNVNKNEMYNKKVKITSIIPSILDHNLFNPNYMSTNSDDNKIINPNETNVYNNNTKYANKIVEKVMFLEMNDFVRGSVYMICSFFRPNNFFPESREEFCMDYDTLTKTIILFSGNSSNINTHQLWKFNLVKNVWTSIESDYSPEPRRGHTGILYKNKYYIFGGQFLSSNMLGKLEIFDLNTNTWSQNNYNNYFLFKLRRNHIACLIGSQMLIHGGVDETGEILDDSYLLNLSTNLIWSKTSIMPILIPPKLAYHSCCLVLTSDILYNNKFSIYRLPNAFITKKLNSRIKEMGMYVFGGKNKTISNDMWLLKIGKKPLEWERVLTFGSPPSPRYLCSMNFFEKGNFIIIHGGKTKISSESFALKDTYLFELYRYQWLRVDYGDKDYIVKKRCSHCSTICDNKLFIFGGINDGVFNGSKFFVINLDVNKAKMSLLKSGKMIK